MGETHWLPQEHDLLEKEWASKLILGLLEAQEYGYLRKISNVLTAKYQEAFNQPFTPETKAEFEKRKARLSTRPAQDKQRIYNWVKRKNQQMLGLDKLDDSCGRRLTGWDLYKRERGSFTLADGTTVPPKAIHQWTTLVRGEWDGLNEDQKGEWEHKADDTNTAEEAKSTSSVPVDEEELAKREIERIKYLRRLEQEVEVLFTKVNVLTGYVSFSLVGGINQQGQMRAFM
ncbi:hypothetical protein OBBRIDRAFT_839836 [Obba rivulosa]|uniref:Uncharacterized protein n=1 Tax=Obba rivulosa TaxID=1052685 RepID=A0A8E2AGX9_9APHY|nr:hypothetical protein OBBRIDRAFT_839836 [Obba rivulosa]